MRVIIAGSRTITNYNIIKEAIYNACWTWRMDNEDIEEIVSGGARGVDKLGEQWVKERNRKCKVFLADWKKHGKKAGYLRNVEMAKYADGLIAIWDGKSRGTKMMIDIAKKEGLITYVYKSKNLILLVGNIGSGKSTYTKKYQKKGYVVIARDQLRYAIGGGQYIYNKEYESIIWETDFYMFASFLELGVNVVLDEININKKMRSYYILYAKEKGYKITVIEMPKFSMIEAVARRMTSPHGQPNRNLWNSVWSNFDEMYEKPTKKEGIDKIIKVKKGDVS